MHTLKVVNTGLLKVIQYLLIQVGSEKKNSNYVRSCYNVIKVDWI